MRKLILGALALAVISVSAVQGHAANLITNGGFETGNFAGWTQSGNTGFTGVSGPGFGDTPFVNNPHSGNFFAFLGPVGSNGFLSQTFGDVAGQRLNISFYLANDGDLPNDFNASFDSTTLLSLTNLPGQAYTLYSFSVIGTGTDTLTIGGFRNDPGYFGLDDVSVTAATPEPSSIALLGTGILGVAGAIRRRMRA